MHDLSPTFSLGVATSFALFAIPGAAAADPAPDPAGQLSDTDHADLAELRARGPAALETLLSQYDHAAPEDRDALAGEIDAVAGQRYATTSRLYWYTDLERAEHAAHQLHRPILALRMLGDLRDDLSCANSRLFRATLYANTQVSAFLRSHFVLYWSSERVVPTVTIDFGDGRKIVRTTTGNSAHYVLDEAGHVLDVLPGLYAPAVFQRELVTSLALAGKVRGMTDAQRTRAVAAYHAAAIDATNRAWQRAGDAPYRRGGQFLLGPDDLASGLARAQAATVSKAVMEVPDLAAIGIMSPNEVPNDAAMWSAIGQKVWNIVDRGAGPGRQPSQAPQPQPQQARAVRGSRVPAPVVLDAASRALVAQLHNAGPVEQRATPAEVDAVIARLEQHIVADTALNQFTLRQTIRRQIVSRPGADFAALNAWIYERVFATPSTDPWLGLRARTDFTGLPGDGVVMP
jgi:hypothetical protein